MGQKQSQPEDSNPKETNPEEPKPEEPKPEEEIKFHNYHPKYGKVRRVFRPKGKFPEDGVIRN